VGDDPTVVQTYRGFWCPKEQAWLRAVVAFQDELEVAYANVVSVSIDPPDVSAAFRAGLGARWTFLSDVERRYLDVLGLRETTDTVHHPYLPAVFVLRPDLTVHAAYNGYWYWGRPGTEELRADLRAVSRALREDWELAQP
jgi:peroxiredoxin